METRGYAVRHCVRLPLCFDCASTVSLSHMAGQVRRRSIAAESKIKCHDLHSRRGSHSGRFDRLLLARHETAYERGLLPESVPTDDAEWCRERAKPNSRQRVNVECAMVMQSGVRELMQQSWTCPSHSISFRRILRRRLTCPALTTEPQLDSRRSYWNMRFQARCRRGGNVGMGGARCTKRALTGTFLGHGLNRGPDKT